MPLKSPSDPDYIIGRLLLRVIGYIAVFPVLLYCSFVRPADNISRPLEQAVWFLIFISAAGMLLWKRSVRGASGSVSTWVLVQIACIVLSVLSGFWWFSHSAQVGRPILFANALYSLYWTYPLVELCIFSFRSIHRTNNNLAVLIPFFGLIPLFIFSKAILDQYSHPKMCVQDHIRDQLRFREQQRYDAEAEEASRLDETDRRRHALMERQAELRTIQKFER